MHRVFTVQLVLQNFAPDVESHASHHRFVGPKNATEYVVVAVKLYIERQHVAYPCCYRKPRIAHTSADPSAITKAGGTSARTMADRMAPACGLLGWSMTYPAGGGFCRFSATAGVRRAATPAQTETSATSPRLPPDNPQHR